MTVRSPDPEDSLSHADQLDCADAEAAKWFARLSADNVSDTDHWAYLDWRQNSLANARAYDRIATAWELVGQHADAPSILEMRVETLAEAPDMQRVSRRMPGFAAIAASVAVIVTASFVMLNGSAPFDNGSAAPAGQIAVGETDDPLPPQAALQDEDVTEESLEAVDFRSGYSTRIGQVAEFSLPDGSVIELNTGSEVQVEYSAARRNLTLVRGEAVFTVAKDADRPFVVAAGESQVVALGTIFSVRTTDREAKVTLIEGRVRVDRNGRSNTEKGAQLTPGQQLSIAPNAPFVITKAELSQVASWREGRLIFEQTPLREVLGEFNRYSVEKHVLRDESIGDYLVNGTFRIQSSKHFAATLEAGFPVKVTPRSGGSVLEVTAAHDSPVPSRVSNK
ncbi:FecR family protein [Erythrobacter crassostreae]|uniref:FecR domain-containing protein n=1 Tax=Erythrobacter crassostreae TaxID=2828328 RepID=A0A9X1JLU1_9SPHN|nr:FecR domain-containing protein [Erythrobacter crassostrea]MBV7258669.1 FecR domain-containing protein [Erythrobacter crassostrea]